MLCVFNLVVEASEKLEGLVDLENIRVVCRNKHVLVLRATWTDKFSEIFTYSMDETTDLILMTLPGSIPDGTKDSGTHSSKTLQFLVNLVMCLHLSRV